MSILNLPDEKIYRICEKLDDVSLAKLIQSNSKFYQICQEILDERKELLDEYSHGFINLSDGFAQFMKDFYFIELIKTKGNIIQLVQKWVILFQETDVPWIDPKIHYKTVFPPGITVYRLATIGYDDIYYILNLLRKQGYKLQSIHNF